LSLALFSTRFIFHRNEPPQLSQKGNLHGECQVLIFGFFRSPRKKEVAGWILKETSAGCDEGVDDDETREFR
jgi:hypothetical protein